MAIGILCLAFPSSADTSAPCSADETSKQVEQQTIKWEQNAGLYGNAASVLAKIDRALEDNKYGECELARVRIARLNVLGMDERSDESIRALQEVVATTRQSNNPEWSRSLMRLSLAYRRQGSFENLAGLTNEYLSEVQGYEASVLEQSLLLAKIGLGEPQSAYALIVNRINTAPQTLTRWDLSFGYALAINLGRPEEASSLKAAAEANFGGLWRPEPLPLLDGDALTHLLARETGSRYTIRVTKMPAPTYPDQAAARGLQGQCDVLMDIGANGKPKNVKAMCTDKLFVSNSEKAVQKMRFEPLVIDGTAYEMPDYIYPLEYSLSN